MNWYSVCCGGGEEERKVGTFLDTSDGQRAANDALKQSLKSKERIRLLEKQVSRMNKARPKIRSTIFAKPIDLTSNYVAPVYPKTEQQRAFLEEALRDNFIFVDLSDSEREMLINAMQLEDVRKGARIIKQGDVGDFFYIVYSGTVEFIDQEEIVGECHVGEGFGELALLYDSPRAVSCDAASDGVSLWKVDQQTFRYILAATSHGDNQSLKELMRKISLFSELDESCLNRFVNAMTPVHWKEGDRIVEKGEEGNVFYIVEQGKVRIHDIGLGDSQYEDQILGAGQWFGERALLTGEPRAANVTALTNASTLAMDRDTFETVLGPLQNLLEREMRINVLKGVPMFARGNITEPEIRQMADLFVTICYKKGEKLAEAGRKYEMNLWIIRHGKLLVIGVKSGTIYNLQSGDHFGDKSICGDPDHISSHNAICEENLTAWVLSKESIESVIGDIHRLGTVSSFAKSFRDPSIRMDQLIKHRILGRGAFGKVWLVSHVESNEAYALKVMSKYQILQAKLDQSVIREKELLCLLEHPFILHLVSSYQDETSLYLLLPLVPGGELYSVLEKNKCMDRGLTNDHAAFYAACIIEGLGHFHQRLIAYRDLKLENVLIDEEGYCRIVDLGFAKVIENKSFTLVGTPEYLAPELIMSKGHDKAVDYWSYGVLLYELLVGHSPFYSPGSSQLNLFKRIVTVKYEVPAFVNGAPRDLIQKLLVRKQANRLGNLCNGYLDVKNHAWFQLARIDFRLLLKKKHNVPWKPEVSNPLDLSNFDSFSEKERVGYSGRKLRSSEQEKFKEF